MCTYTEQQPRNNANQRIAPEVFPKMYDVRINFICDFGVYLKCVSISVHSMQSHDVVQ